MRAGAAASIRPVLVFGWESIKRLIAALLFVTKLKLNYLNNNKKYNKILMKFLLNQLKDHSDSDLPGQLGELISNI